MGKKKSQKYGTRGHNDNAALCFGDLNLPKGLSVSNSIPDSFNVSARNKLTFLVIV